MRTRPAMLSIFLAICLLVDGIDDSLAADTRSPQKRAAAPRWVTVARVERKALDKIRVRMGKTYYRRIARLHTREAGQVVFLDVYPGDSVTKNQLLVRLDQRLLKTQLRKAKIEARRAQQLLARIERLQKTQAASTEELQEARSELDLALAEVDILKLRLQYTEIRAPFDAIVLERLVDPNDSVVSNRLLLTLADPHSLQVHAQVEPALLRQLSIGMPVLLSPLSTPRHKFEGRIQRIHPKLLANGLGQIDIVFNTLPSHLQAGQHMRIEIQGLTHQGLFIPFSALRRDAKGEYVFVAEMDQAKRVAVESGVFVENFVQILDGLSEGQQVITRGFIGLSDGRAIRISKPHAEQEKGQQKKSKSAIFPTQ